jgi:DNA-binding MarR family transcriptional regulator
VIPERGQAAGPEPPDPGDAGPGGADQGGADQGGADQGGADQGGADQGGADPGGDESLAEAFLAVARKLREKSAETLAPWDVTPAHLRALRTLSRHGTMRLSELSERLQIAPRTATEVVDALQARDLVRRRADPGDRRATLVEVTEHGADILADIRATGSTEAGRVLGRLNPADRADLTRILAKLRD